MASTEEATPAGGAPAYWWWGKTATEVSSTPLWWGRTAKEISENSAVDISEPVKCTEAHPAWWGKTATEVSTCPSWWGQTAAASAACAPSASAPAASAPATSSPSSSAPAEAAPTACPGAGPKNFWWGKTCEEIAVTPPWWGLTANEISGNCRDVSSENTESVPACTPSWWGKSAIEMSETPAWWGKAACEVLAETPPPKLLSAADQKKMETDKQVLEMKAALGKGGRGAYQELKQLVQEEPIGVQKSTNVMAPPPPSAGATSAPPAGATAAAASRVTDLEDVMEAKSQAQQQGEPTDKSHFPVYSQKMVKARSLVSRQEKLYDSLEVLCKEFRTMDTEVHLLKNQARPHYFQNKRGQWIII